MQIRIVNFRDDGHDHLIFWGGRQCKQWGLKRRLGRNRLKFKDIQRPMVGRLIKEIDKAGPQAISLD